MTSVRGASLKPKNLDEMFVNDLLNRVPSMRGQFFARIVPELLFDRLRC